MSDDDQKFAAELASLRPVRPSRDLEQRIGISLATRQPCEARRSVVGWLALGGLAAAFAFSTVGRLPPDILLPTGTASTVYAAEDEGLVRLADGTPARRTRIHSIETTTWQNPRTKASLQMSHPSEEIHDEPLTFN